MVSFGKKGRAKSLAWRRMWESPLQEKRGWRLKEKMASRDNEYEEKKSQCENAGTFLLHRSCSIWLLNSSFFLLWKVSQVWPRLAAQRLGTERGRRSKGLQYYDAKLKLIDGVQSSLCQGPLSNPAVTFHFNNRWDFSRSQREEQIFMEQDSE